MEQRNELLKKMRLTRKESRKEVRGEREKGEGGRGERTLKGDEDSIYFELFF